MDFFLVEHSVSRSIAVSNDFSSGWHIVLFTMVLLFFSWSFFFFWLSWWWSFWLGRSDLDSLD